MKDFRVRGGARAWIAALALAALLTGWTSSRADVDESRRQWVATWTASQQAPEPPAIGANPPQFSNQTIRQIVRVSMGGTTARIRLRNEFGRTLLRVGEVRIAHQLAGPSTVPGSDKVVTFGGRASVTIPAGAPLLSDPIDIEGLLVVSCGTQQSESLLVVEPGGHAAFEPVHMSTGRLPGARNCALEWRRCSPARWGCSRRGWLRM